MIIKSLNDTEINRIIMNLPKIYISWERNIGIELILVFCLCKFYFITKSVTYHRLIHQSNEPHSNRFLVCSPYSSLFVFVKTINSQNHSSVQILDRNIVTVIACNHSFGVISLFQVNQPKLPIYRNYAVRTHKQCSFVEFDSQISSSSSVVDLWVVEKVDPFEAFRKHDFDETTFLENRWNQKGIPQNIS